MSDTPDDLMMQLTYVLDELRETTSLLPVAELTRESARPWWRNLFFAFARSRAEVGAGFAVQYLGENLERARRHWIEAKSLLDAVQRAHPQDPVIVELGRDLHTAGCDDVLDEMADDAIPYSAARTGAHLAKVVSKIRGCDQAALRARSRLALRRMRDTQS
ncbi:MAG: hypothetical protein ABI949_12820 [Ilumatobacteraceae bacterium]